MKVCIDAGHGASNRRKGKYDPGATSAGLEEADIALQWALTGKFILSELGFDVHLTRDDDRDESPVGSRDEMAEKAGCTHFISVHCNAGGGTGVETYYRDSGDLPLARMVNNALVGATGGKDRGIKNESDSQHPRLAVMDFKGPCCLCETGFIDTAKDRKWLTSRDVRIKFWKAVGAGLNSIRGKG